MSTEAQREKEMPKAYDPKLVEQRLYDFWMDKGFFTPKIDPSKEPFTIIMPPPNVTGELHLGHALVVTIEDIMTRWHRMLGDPTLWLPGVDHAGIAGQNVVEQQIAAEGLTRHDLGREKFLDRVWDWMHRYRDVIMNQHKRLGASCDWTRERFTMDPGPSVAVRTTFYNLYKKGLIYRGERLINWCPRCATALSDLEVEHEEVQGHLWYVRYKLAPEKGASQEKDEYIMVATTRPETILGDTAVAVNPMDERYAKFVGREAILPVLGRVISIVADEAVDPTFGTGAVKVTPAHDPVDFEIGQRHNLPSINVMNLDATMNTNAGPYEGMDRFACRKKLVADLEKEGLLVRIETYTHSIGHCQRCKTIVEPLISLQWFVDIKPLADPAIEAVKDGRIKMVPDRFTRVYLNWMENIRDWCISRQLWWGHRIPVWYCHDCDALTVAIEDPTSCEKCGSKNIHQDPDVLDTWFSSGLWPHSTLGWPADTEDFRYFYPTSVMETAYDILFFWVARMIMMGLENTGEVPFRTVYFHGLVRDEKGDKMSKSRGNVVNPLETMNIYGTDALRYTLATGSTPGNDMKLSTQKLEGSRNFANKLWNAARYVMSTVDQEIAAGWTVYQLPPRNQMRLADRWILSRLNHLVASVNQLMEDYQYGEAGRQTYEFLWGEFCDWYIEIAKVYLREGGKGSSPVPVLVHTLETGLRLLHPVMPFLTEEIWQILTGKEGGREKYGESIMIAAYPTVDDVMLDTEAESGMDLVMEIIRSIRNARAEFGVEAAKWVEGIIVSDREWETLESQDEVIKRLARTDPVEILTHLDAKPHQALALVVGSVEVYLPLAGMVDLNAERERLRKEIATIEGDIARAASKLANQDFVSRAPAQVVEKERERVSAYQETLTKLNERLASLK